ncbi:MAG: EI24 domain-containing protein [Desulfobacterales bacterium]|nr:MAG: EI24 domain-containing protein [Desulfobacterales bacterium]
MNVLSGITYNWRGLRLALQTPKLLLLGLVRFAAVVLITLIFASLVLVYHQEILNYIWTKPETRWILWGWYLLSWLLAFLLIGLSAVMAFILSQILFSAFIMDLMSRITEKMLTGQTREPQPMPKWRLFLYLVRQEIPRAILPVLLTLGITIFGWLTAFGPVLTIVSAAAAVIFLAWDNTDLVPARRLEPFNRRFKSLLKSLPFHLGFGLLFLIPGVNIVFLAFAPVGATLYAVDKQTA